MDPQDQTRKNLAEGLVLDEQGQWVALGDKLAAEKAFREHLEAGEVLVDGKWATLTEAKDSSLQKDA